MKVICIDDSATYGKHIFLTFGKTYEPVGESISSDGIDCYIIENPYGNTVSFVGGPDHGLPLYKKSRFIPISDIDELELAEQRLVTA